MGIYCLVGCRKDEKPPPTAAPAKDFRAGLPQAGTLDAQLAAEAAARQADADTISIEKLIAGLSDAGIPVVGVHQLMGRNQLAIYCAMGDTTDGAVITVCEYPSTEAAVNGEKEANRMTSQVAGHSSHVRKKSVLHLIKKSTTPETTVQQILAAFEAG